MKKYELSVLFQPEFEADTDTATAKVKKIIEDNGGKMLSEEIEGKKKMAYQIKGQDFALYTFYTVELPVEAPEKVSNVLNITEGVLRYLLVSEDPRKVKYEAKQASRKQEESKEE